MPAAELRQRGKTSSTAPRDAPAANKPKTSPTWLRVLFVFCLLLGTLLAITFGILHQIHGGAPPLEQPPPQNAPLPDAAGCAIAPSLGDRPAPSQSDAVGARLAAGGMWDSVAKSTCMFERDAFLTLPGHISPQLTTEFLSEATASLPFAHRRGAFSPGKGEAIPYDVVKRQMPLLYGMYKSAEFIEYLEQLSGEKLLPSLEEDPHAAAIYWYNSAGDGINWHYDTSFLEGKRFTVLIPLLDDSSSRLHVQLYTRNESMQAQDVVVRTQPGDFIFFNGDLVRHRVTAMGPNEKRMMVTMEYVTSHKTAPGPWMVYRLSQWGGYFGFPTELYVAFYGGLLALSYWIAGRPASVATM